MSNASMAVPATTQTNMEAYSRTQPWRKLMCMRSREHIHPPAMNDGTNHHILASGSIRLVSRLGMHATILSPHRKKYQTHTDDSSLFGW
jgi:hypothetical protein